MISNWPPLHRHRLSHTSPHTNSARAKALEVRSRHLIGSTVAEQITSVYYRSTVVSLTKQSSGQILPALQVRRWTFAFFFYRPVVSTKREPNRTLHLGILLEARVAHFSNNLTLQSNLCPFILWIFLGLHSLLTVSDTYDWKQTLSLATSPGDFNISAGSREYKHTVWKF